MNWKKKKRLGQGFCLFFSRPLKIPLSYDITLLYWSRPSVKLLTWLCYVTNCSMSLSPRNSVLNKSSLIKTTSPSFNFTWTCFTFYISCLFSLAGSSGEQVKLLIFTTSSFLKKLLHWNNTSRRISYSTTILKTFKITDFFPKIICNTVSLSSALFYSQISIVALPRLFRFHRIETLSQKD